MKKIMFALALIFGTIALQAKDYVIASFHSPQEYIQKAKGDNFSFTEPVLWVEVIQGENKILERTDGQNISGNKVDFHFNKKISLADNKFPIVVKIFVGEKKTLERGARAAAGGGIGATVGGIIGGCLAGFCTGGLGAPAGAAIGIAIGGGVGAGASLLAPVRDAREVASFAFSSFDQFIGTHKKSCGNDILTDGQEVRLIIK